MRRQLLARESPVRPDFRSSQWETRELVSRYPTEWSYLVKHSGPPPQALPPRFSSRPIAEHELNEFAIKAVALSTDSWSDDVVLFENGFLSAQPDDAGASPPRA